MRKFLDLQDEKLPKCAILTDDPMRVKMLTAHHLEQAALCNDLRNMIGYTGSYLGVPVVVQSVGYGEASAVAYLHEMVSRYGVETVVYVGECVSFDSSVSLRDVILASAAHGKEDVSGANMILLQNAGLAAQRLSIPLRTINVQTDDRYGTDEILPSYPQAHIIDFATHAIYTYAEGHNVAALSVLTVSEHALTGNCIDTAERQSRFHAAAGLAFETVTSEN